MDPSVFMTFGLALGVGVVMGLLGAGGSILTLPLLVYVLGHNEKAGAAESLAIVGSVSFLSAMIMAWRRQINWRYVVLFGTPGVVGTYLGAWANQWLPGWAQMMLFACVLLGAAGAMIRRRGATLEDAAKDTTKKHSWGLVVAEGMTVGVLTGIVGVGGGFLIVPALVLLGGLPMHVAVGTSLAIISLKSGVGFVKYLEVLDNLGLRMDWTSIWAFSGFGLVGATAGQMIGKGLDQRLLRTLFGWFVLAVGIMIIAAEARKAVMHDPGPETAGAVVEPTD